MLKGDFTEDLERIQETYERRFVNYSCKYHNSTKQKDFERYGKLRDKYLRCNENMKKVLTIINRENIY